MSSCTELRYYSLDQIDLVLSDDKIESDTKDEICLL